MKDDRLYARMGKGDKARLITMSMPYGGVGDWILAKMKEIVPAAKVTPVVGLVPSASSSCKGCSEKETQLTIVRAKLLMVEKELGLLKRDKKVEREEVPKSPYRLGPGV